MRPAVLVTTAALVLLTMSLAAPRSALAGAETETALTEDIQIPESLRIEHGEIHAKLVEAMQAPGQVGDAARKLAHVLHPHFVREEEIALPPLGLLGPLAAGASLAEAPQSQALAMTDSLKAELPRMLEEHRQIKVAVEELHLAASAASATDYVRLAEALSVHARTEEEVMYPAAILVGEMIRMRMGKE